MDRKNSTLLGLITVIFKVASGLIVYPIALKCLNSFDLSIYLLIISTASLFELLDFNFTGNLIRYFSYIEGGSQSQDKNIFIEENFSNSGSSLFCELLLMAKLYYKLLCVFCFILIGIGFSFYLYFFTKSHHQAFFYYECNWLLYSTAVLLSVYFMYLAPALISKGMIDKVNKISLISKLSGVIVQLILIYWLGLPALLIGAFVTTIVERTILYNLFAKVINFDIKIKLDQNRFWYILKIFWQNNYRLGLIALIWLFLNKLSSFVAGFSITDTHQLAEFLFSMQIFSLASFLASVPINNNFSDISTFIVNNKSQAIKLFLKNNRQSLLLLISISIAVVIFGHSISELLKLKHSFLEIKYLLVIILINILDKQLLNNSTMITIFNQIPMLKAYLISAIVITVSIFIGCFIFHLGIWGLLIPQLIVQSLYNYWYWVYYNIKLMLISVKDYSNSLFLGKINL